MYIVTNTLEDREMAQQLSIFKMIKKRKCFVGFNLCVLFHISKNVRKQLD